MSTPEQPDTENPFEPPQTTDNDPDKRRRRRTIFILGIFLVPLAAAIAGFVTCWAAVLPASALMNGPSLDTLLVVGELAFMVGAIAGLIAAIRFFQHLANK